jgi:antitoxin ParD1/3/4
MEIVLTQELEELVRQQVASGAYSSPSEVVANSLRLLKEREALESIRREELRRDILVAKEEIKRGEGKVYESPDELLEEIITDGQRRLAQSRNGSAHE